MDGIIGEKRARSWEIDEISAFDVLKILNTENHDLMKNEHDFELSVAPVKLDLANGGRLEKNGDIYIVHDNAGVSFIIRKIGDKMLDTRTARTSFGYTPVVYVNSLPNISFSYVKINKDFNSIKIESINDNVHDPKALENLIRRHLK